MDLTDRIRIREIKLLSDNHYVLKRATFDWRRADGEWQTQIRESYDRGNGCALLPYNLEKRTVVLVRQFRYPAYANGYRELMIEAPAGLLDEADPETRIRAEVEEEAGLRLKDIQKVFETFMSPGSVTEKLWLYVGAYDDSMRISDGGGHHDEGEDIDVLELPFETAFQMMADGRICDGKTIMLLQWAQMNLAQAK